MRKNIVKVELGKICDYSKGKKPKVLTKEYSEKTPFPYINIKAFEYGVFDEYTDGDKCNLCENGDLLMVWDGARAGFIGKAKKGAVGSTLMKIEAKEGIEKDYLFYFLLSLYKKINTNPRGVGIPHVEPSLLWTSELIIRSIPEQRAIVQKIENYFELLDKGIADLKTAQEQLKIYRQAVLKKAFEGRFTNKNVKEGELPEGWKLVKLREVAEINPKLPNKEEINSSLEIQFLPMKLVEEEINKIHLIETRLFHEVQKGSYTPFIENDIIFAKVTPCMENGKIAITKNLKNGIGYGSSEFHVIRCIGEILNTYIFHYVVQSRFRKEAENQMTGAVGLRRVPKKFLENYFIPFPPTLSEQHTIVREIESRLSVCDKVEQSISESLEKAEALRQSILKKAFEGKLLSGEEIAQCKQEADYEPANVLLERIRKENKHGK
ncbi:MAG: hypothetical protein GX896_05780 [Clostridiales bacterium]|nr:hypothetical protein [Clostridiales bacterium]